MGGGVWVLWLTERTRAERGGRFCPRGRGPPTPRAGPGGGGGLEGARGPGGGGGAPGGGARGGGAEGGEGHPAADAEELAAAPDHPERCGAELRHDGPSCVAAIVAQAAAGCKAPRLKDRPAESLPSEAPPTHQAEATPPAR